MNTNPAESYMTTLMALVPGVAHSITPNALIDWNTMEISYEGGCDERFVPFATHTKKFSSLLELTNFVDQNKDRIVIHDAFLPPKIDDPDFAPVRRGAMLKYAKNPNMDYFITAGEVAQANYKTLRDFHDACIKELYRQLGIDGEDGEYRFKWVSLEVHRLLDENKKLKKEIVKLTEQKRPKFHPGEHLLNELHRCQNGECSCAWLANEIENYIEEEVEVRCKEQREKDTPEPAKLPIPSTLEEALVQLESNLSEEDRKIIAEKDPAAFHFSVGMSLRNRWELWTGTSPLSMWFFERGIKHADDMSGIILTALKHRVMGTPYDMDADVKFYQDYWAKKAAKD